MVCPTCGLTNSGDALKCDGGYDFKEGKPSLTPGWPISLSWSQKTIAFWSICWPAAAGSIFLVSILTGGYELEPLREFLPLFPFVLNLLFFGFQSISVHRLVRKNYQSFRVHVIRPDGQQVRRLSFREGLSIWLWILGPQLALAALLSLGVWWTDLELDAIRQLGVFERLLRYFIVGPFAVGLALSRSSPTFRLQAHGFRYI